MADQKPIVWSRNRGRDGWSRSVFEVRPDQSRESRNITLYNGALGSKRAGSIALTESGLSGHNALIEYVPAQDLTAAELWIVDNSATKKILRSTTGTSASPTLVNQTLKDNITAETPSTNGVVLNGKLYLAYTSGVNRLHVFDPNNASANTVRRAGLAPFASAATVANTGAGAYPAVARYYKTRSIEQQSSLAIRRSEGNTASTVFTPSGGGTAARITRPTAVGEGETHWEVYGSTDGITYYGPIGTIAIGTTTYDDSSTPSAWATTYDAEPVAGFYTPFPSVRFLGTTGSRLYGFGVRETTAGDSLAPKNGRLYFGPVLDSSGTQDDERISNTTTIKGFIDVARNSGVQDRGVTTKPVANIIYAFQSAGIYGFVPTESDTTPYRRVIISTTVGAVNQQSIVIGVDRSGGECVFFLDPTLGPYVTGGAYSPPKWCGKDVKDLWDTFNPAAANVAACGVWFPGRNQVKFWIATGSSDDTDTVLTLDPTEMYLDDDGDLRGGWTVETGVWAGARTAVMFSNTCATTRSRVRVPYVGLASGTVLLRYDETAQDDNGTAFQAFITSGVLAASTHNLSITEPYLRASAQSGVTIQAAVIRNQGDETNRVDTTLLTPTGSQTGLLRKFEGLSCQDADALQVTLGDAAAVASVWRLDGFTMTLTVGARR